MPRSNSVLLDLQAEVIDFWHLRSTAYPAEKPHLKDCVGYFVCLGAGSSSPFSSSAQQECSAEDIETAEKRFNTLTSTIIQLEPRYIPSEDRDKSMQATVPGSRKTSAELQQQLVDSIEEGIDISDQSKSDAYAYLGDLYKREKHFLEAGQAYEKSYKLARESIKLDLIPFQLKRIAYTFFLHEDREGLEYVLSIAYGDELLTECSTIFGLDSVEFALAEVFVCGISKSARGLSMELSHLLSDATSTLVFKLGVDHELTRTAQEDLKAVRTLIQYRKNQEKEQKARSVLLPRLGLVHGFDVLTRNMEIKLNNTDNEKLQEVVSSGDIERRGEIGFVDFELSYDHPKLDWFASKELRLLLKEYDAAEGEGGEDSGNRNAHVERLVRSLKTRKEGGAARASAVNREGLLILNGGTEGFADDDASSTTSTSGGGGAKGVSSPVFSLSSRSNHVHPAGTSMPASASPQYKRGVVSFLDAGDGGGGSDAGDRDVDYSEEKRPTSGSAPRVRQNRLGAGRGRVGLDPFEGGDASSFLEKVRAREEEKARRRREEDLRRAEEAERERKRFEPLSLESWQSVSDWLRDRGEHEAARAVKKKQISGRVLLKLDHRGWKELGVVSAADRAKLMMGVENYYSRWDLRNGSGLVPVPATATLLTKFRSTNEGGGEGSAVDVDSLESSSLSSRCMTYAKNAFMDCLAFVCCAEREQQPRKMKAAPEEDDELALDPRNPHDEELARRMKLAEMVDAPGFKTSRVNRGKHNPLEDRDD